ncbi:cold shock domain-containing protein [Rhodococcus pyridinivorans]|uniref:cold shock domain-containing protein n=1 Tax=Rhodococcus pyridinivorans TaxID=103816 RepID=UPI0039B46771
MRRDIVVDMGSVMGVVRVWHGELGWGVLDSSETPGGGWAHWSHIDTTGFCALEAGEVVDFEWEERGQDGCRFRATRVRRRGR